MSNLLQIVIFMLINYFVKESYSAAINPLKYESEITIQNDKQSSGLQPSVHRSLMEGSMMRRIGKRSLDSQIDGLLPISKKISAFANNGQQNTHLPSLLRNKNEQRGLNEVKEANAGEQKISLPGPIPIDIEQVKKIAQIIEYIGNQLLPAIIDPNGSIIPEDSIDEV